MIVDMRDICKDYPSASGTVSVLHDICLQVEEGDYIAIMGPSGSGKTTLMNIIGFLDLPTSGTYLLNGVDETQSNEDKLAEVRNKNIGFVFQTFYLLPGLTALENVALPLLYADVPTKERNERAAEALRMVGLEDRMTFYPRQLSGGQCQRVAIARAMVGRPQLLLADEPTGALDTISGSQIMDIFEQLNRDGMTIVMITHEPAVAECANRIYHILDGRIQDGALTALSAPENGTEQYDNALPAAESDDAGYDNAVAAPEEDAVPALCAEAEDDAPKADESAENDELSFDNGDEKEVFYIASDIGGGEESTDEQ